MKVTLKPGETVKIARTDYPIVSCHFINFKMWQGNGKSRVYMSDYKSRTIGYIDAVSGETIINDNQGMSKYDIEYAINGFMASYTEKTTTEKITVSVKKRVMLRAWEIARQGVAKFGGKVKEYFAVSLKMAWAEIKETLSLAKKIQRIVKAYRCRLVGGKIRVSNSIHERPEDIAFVKAHKDLIIDFIKRAEEKKQIA